VAATGCLCTFVFEDGDEAITESHVYLNASNIAAAIQPAKELVKLRMLLMGYGVALRYIRLSMLNVFRDSQILGAMDITGVPSPPQSYVSVDGKTFPSSPEGAKACLLLRMEYNTQIRRPMFLGGVPVGTVVNQPPAPPIINFPLWGTNFQNWKNKITSGLWGFQARTPSSAVGQVVSIQPIISAFNDVQKALIAVVVGPFSPPLVPNQQVQVYQSKMQNVAYTPLNGQWVIDSIVPGQQGQNAVYLTGSGNVNASTLTKRGFLRTIDFTAVPYQNVQIRDNAERKRGNRSLAGPGRRRILRRI
jgi:hypothetical protein